MTEKKENPYHFLKRDERQLLKQEYIRRIFQIVAYTDNEPVSPKILLDFKDIQMIRENLDIIELLNEIK